MDRYYPTSPKKFTFKIKNCNCNCHETRVRKCLKKIGDVELISINFENNTYTVSTIKSPAYVIQYLQTLLHKEIKLLHEEGSGSNNDHGDVRYDGHGDVMSVGYASPPSLPPPPWRSVSPSAPVLPPQEVYGYPVIGHPASPMPPYYYYGSSTSSDDHPKDYPCSVM